MNDNTAKLLEQLANKLGTTTEYLWSILLKQAAIDATTTLLQIVTVVVASYFLYRTHKRLSKKVAKDDSRYSYAESGYDKGGEGMVVVMILAGIVCAILLIVCFLCIGDVINGYFNPEYWALRRVLDAVTY